MINRRKRITAMVLSLALVLTGLTALAQSVPSYEQTDFTISIDRDVLANFLSPSGTQDQPSLPLGADSEAAIKLIVGALSKIRGTVFSGPGLNSILIDTQEDLIADIYLVDDQDGSQSTITTSLLPGVAIRVPQETMDNFINVLPTVDNIFGKEGEFNAYLTAIDQYFRNNVPGSQQPVQVEEEIPDAGLFTRRTSFEVDNKLVLGLGSALLDVFRQDRQGQEMVNLLLGRQPAQEGDTSPRNASEVIALLEKAIADAGAQENRLLGEQTIYETEDGLASYVVTDINAKEAVLPRMRLSLLNRGDENGFDRLSRFVLIVDSPDGETHSQEKPDWDAVRHDILSGTNKEDSMITIYDEQSLAESEQVSLHSSVFTLHTDIGPISVSSDKTVSIAGRGERGGLSLYLLSNEALVTLNYAQAPIDESRLPALPSQEDLVEVIFSDGVSSQEDSHLTQVLLTRGLPALLVNLVQSLPDEAEYIISLMMPTTLTP